MDVARLSYLSPGAAKGVEQLRVAGRASRRKPLARRSSAAAAAHRTGDRET